MAERQEKLLERLNLDGLAHWSPENVVAVRELVLAYHDVFALESNELGCTSAIEHGICIENDEPFEERFRHIPQPLLEEVCASLRDMLEAGAIHPSQSPWCNVVILVQKKDSTLHFCVDLRHLNVCMDSGGPGKHGGVGTFLVDGFQVRLLADQDGPRIATVHSLYGGELWVLQVYPNAVWAVQCISDISASHAEHLRGAEPYVLCHLLGRCHSLQPHGRGAPGALACGVSEVLGVQFEA